MPLVRRATSYARVPGPAIGVLLFSTHIYLGLGYLMGPARFTSSGSYTYALVLAPQAVWGGAVFAGAGLCLIAPHVSWRASVLLHALAAAPLMVLSGAFLAAQIARVSEGWGGAGLLVYPVLAHAALSLMRYREAELWNHR